jgi:hypothetical protein
MSSLRGNAEAFVPHGQSYAGVVTTAPLWLLDDSDDEDDQYEEQMAGKMAKDVDSDSGVASTDDCGATSCEETDSDEEEQPEAAGSSSMSSSTASTISPATPSAFDELQAELSRAREHARAALEESRQLAAEAQLVTKLREAREHATQLRKNVQAAGLSALEYAVSNATQKDLQSEQHAKTNELESMTCLSLLESEVSTKAEPSHEALPSKGSVLHSAGNCKSCSFFPLGRCERGVDCPFCHLSHDRRLERKMRKKDRVAGALKLKAEIETHDSVFQILAATSDTKQAVDLAVRSELLKRLGTPPGLELVPPPGLPLQAHEGAAHAYEAAYPTLASLRR